LPPRQNPGHSFTLARASARLAKMPVEAYSFDPLCHVSMHKNIAFLKR